MQIIPSYPALANQNGMTVTSKFVSDASVQEQSNITKSGAISTVRPIAEKQDADPSVHAVSSKILDLIFEYALNKFSDSKERLEAGRPKFLSVVGKFVATSTRVEMCLPAFPFKSANKAYKVFGILPDKAEEIALDRLNTMCIRIGEIYQPGAQCTIISDGVVYNDLLSIPDRDTWAYGQALRHLASDKGFQHISFSRIRDLVDIPLPAELHEIAYVANATNFRRALLNRFGKDDIDIDEEIGKDPDTKMTYLGYRRFLESDLKHIFPVGNGRTANAYRRDVRYLAKQMLIRGYAFASAVKHGFPDHLRLSIHQSTGKHKVSICLLNTKTGFTTPWHCCVALTATGEWTSAPKGEYLKDPNMKVIQEDGRPSYFQETVGISEPGQKAQTETREANGSESQSNAPNTEPQETPTSSLTEADIERVAALAKFMMSADFKQNDGILKLGHPGMDKVLDCKSNELSTVARLKELISAVARGTGGYNEKVVGVTYQEISVKGAHQLSNT
ncbi:spore wall maturation DIT1 [Fusarium phyllophilum]|uniref:Spore wall maturation DIT1 n=1 Tax=Fusarium phyllophilum TaxID=47803 RepID=A0A8H5K5Z2_9HYPO|nr:spore wall maturation DIT1 [Fusarium phyllophilum]